MKAKHLKIIIRGFFVVLVITIQFLFLVRTEYHHAEGFVHKLQYEEVYRLDDADGNLQTFVITPSVERMYYWGPMDPQTGEFIQVIGFQFIWRQSDIEILRFRIAW